MSNLLSRESSTLSSAPTNPSEYHNTSQSAGNRLRRYVRQGTNDQTLLILNAFLAHLPIEGRINVANDILESDTDEQLRRTANNFSTTVLGPSKHQ
jgi:hypothetical protein